MLSPLATKISSRLSSVVQALNPRALTLPSGSLCRPSLPRARSVTMTSKLVDDPYDWTVEQVVHALCVEPALWYRGASLPVLPPVEIVERALRENDITGLALLTYVDDVTLRQDLQIRSPGHRAYIWAAIRALRHRSQRYNDELQLTRTLSTSFAVEGGFSPRSQISMFNPLQAAVHSILATPMPGQFNELPLAGSSLLYQAQPAPLAGGSTPDLTCSPATVNIAALGLSYPQGSTIEFSSRESRTPARPPPESLSLRSSSPKETVGDERIPEKDIPAVPEPHQTLGGPTPSRYQPSLACLADSPTFNLQTPSAAAARATPGLPHSPEQPLDGISRALSTSAEAPAAYLPLLTSPPKDLVPGIGIAAEGHHATDLRAQGTPGVLGPVPPKAQPAALADNLTLNRESPPAIVNGVAAPGPSSLQGATGDGEPRTSLTPARPLPAALSVRSSSPKEPLANGTVGTNVRKEEVAVTDDRGRKRRKLAPTRIATPEFSPEPEGFPVDHQLPPVVDAKARPLLPTAGIATNNRH